MHTSLLPLSEAAPSPGAAIVTFATAGRFKLVVLGSRGMGAFKRRFFSTLSERLSMSFKLDKHMQSYLSGDPFCCIWHA